MREWTLRGTEPPLEEASDTSNTTVGEPFATKKVGIRESLGFGIAIIRKIRGGMPKDVLGSS